MKIKIVAVLLLSAFVFSLSACDDYVVYSDYRVKDEQPLDTLFLPDMPDSAVVILGKEKKEVPTEKIEAIFDKINEVIDARRVLARAKKIYTGGEFEYNRKKYISVEFRYENRRRYVDTSDDSERKYYYLSEVFGNYEYDALSFMCNANYSEKELEIVPYRGDRYYQNKYTHITTEDGNEAIDELETILKEILNA